MAKDEKKAADNKAAEPDQGKGGGKGGIVMIVAAALVALGLGAGGAFFFASTQVHATKPAAESEGHGSEESADEGGEHGAPSGEHGEGKKGASDAYKERLYALEPMVVNVTGDGYNRFLKVRVELEASKPELKTELDSRLPQVRDAMIVLLSSKQLSDITDFEGKALLKEDIIERLNDLLETGEIKSVLFTEFVVQ